MSSEPASPTAESAAGTGGSQVAQSLLARFDGAADGPLGEFARAYARRVTSGPLDEPGIDALAAQVAGLFEFISERRPGDIHVRAFNPDGARDGWSCRGSVLEANVDDMPFLIDSVTEELRRRGLAVRNVMHPVIGVERDGNGRLAAVVPARGALHRESVMHFEVDRRLPDAELEELTSAVIRVIGDVALSVRDFHAMADRVGRMIEFAQVASARYSRDEIAETVSFLEWLTQDNFVFLGYREYAIEGEDENATVSVVPDSGLGVLSDESGSTFSVPKRIAELPENIRERVVGGPLLIVSKTNRESTVHRRVRMDHIGVKRVGPDGSIVGELRMIGLFTSKAYAEPARHIPLVRRKLETIMSRRTSSRVARLQGSRRDLRELPQGRAVRRQRGVSADDGDGLMAMEEQRQIALFLRNDYRGTACPPWSRCPAITCTTELRTRLAALLEERFGGDRVEYHLTYGEAEPARFHFSSTCAGISRTSPGRARGRGAGGGPIVGRPAGRCPLQGASARRGPRAGPPLRRAVPRLLQVGDAALHGQVRRGRVREARARPGIRDRPPERARERREPDPAEAVQDRRQGDAGRAAADARASRAAVVEEVPTRLQEHQGEGRYLHDFGVYGPDGSQLDLETLGPLVADAVGAVWDGRAESDSLNRLVPCRGAVVAAGHDPPRLSRVPPGARRRLHHALPERRFVRNGTMASS